MISNHLLFNIRKSQIQGLEPSIIYIYFFILSLRSNSVFFFSGFFIVGSLPQQLEYAIDAHNTSHINLQINPINSINKNSHFA